MSSPRFKKIAPQTALVRRIFLRASKLPIVYLLIGILLNALAYIDNIFTLTEYKTAFDHSDKIGDIFIAFSILTFIYQVLVFALQHSESLFFKKHHITSLILASIRKGLRIIFVLVAINISIDIIGPTQPYLMIANNIINTIIIAAIGWLAIRVLYTFEAVMYQHTNKLDRKEHIRAKALYTKTRIMRNLATVLIIIITIGAMLMSFSSVRNIGISLLASAGFLTAIIGLSAQKTLFSLFSGLQIAFSQPIKIGDIVVIEKESGMIEEITFTYVIIKLGDRRRMIVPIHYFIDRPFENCSHDPESLRSSLHIYVDYLMPIYAIREALDTILKKSTFWDGIAHKVEVAHITPKCVKLRIQVSAANADDLADLRAEVREKILAFIQAHYPQYFPT